MDCSCGSRVGVRAVHEAQNAGGLTEADQQVNLVKESEGSQSLRKGEPPKARVPALSPHLLGGSPRLRRHPPTSVSEQLQGFSIVQ